MCAIRDWGDVHYYHHRHHHITSHHTQSHWRSYILADEMAIANRKKGGKKERSAKGKESKSKDKQDN